MDFSPEHILNFLESIAHDPLMLALALALSTFITEDGALIAGSLLVGSEIISPGFAIITLSVGLLVGDIGLYGLGWAARSNSYLRKKLPITKTRRIRRWLKPREATVLFFSRFMPGTRFVTYVTFGFLKLSVIRFILVMTIAAVFWVTGMVLFISEIQQAFAEYGSVAGFISAIVLAIGLIIFVPHIIKLFGVSAVFPQGENEENTVTAQIKKEAVRGRN